MRSERVGMAKQTKRSGASGIAVLGCVVALSLVLAGSAQALEFASPIPATYAAGFDVSDPQTDWLLSTAMGDYLALGSAPGPGIQMAISSVEEYMYAGSSGWQSTLPSGLSEFTVRSTWTVTDIDIAVPDDGIMLYIAGMASTDYVPPSGPVPIPDFPLGSVQVLTGGGVLGGASFDPLDELSYAGTDYAYYGVRVFDVGDALQFGYVGYNSQPEGAPALHAAAGINFVPVPEPGSALLVGLGLAAMAFARPGRARQTRD